VALLEREGRRTKSVFYFERDKKGGGELGQRQGEGKKKKI